MAQSRTPVGSSEDEVAENYTTSHNEVDPNDSAYGGSSSDTDAEDYHQANEEHEGTQSSGAVSKANNGAESGHDSAHGFNLQLKSSRAPRKKQSQIRAFNRRHSRFRGRPIRRDGQEIRERDDLADKHPVGRHYLVDFGENRKDIVAMRRKLNDICDCVSDHVVPTGNHSTGSRRH